MGTAFNIGAVFAVCGAHHALFHSRPVEYRDIARSCLGEAYERLRELSRMEVRFRADDYARIRLALKRQEEVLRETYNGVGRWRRND
jgi:hypothetical protein